MFDHSPSDRVQLAGIGDLLHPGCCFLCGSGNCEQGYIDFGILHEFEGNLYLCRTCVVQCAEVIGCLTPEEAIHLQEQNEMLAKANAALLLNLEAASERLNAFDSVLSGIPGLSTLLDSSNPAPSDDSLVESTGEVTSDADGGKPESEEPVTEPGRNDADGTTAVNSKRRKSSIEL